MKMRGRTFGAGKADEQRHRGVFGESGQKCD